MKQIVYLCIGLFIACEVSLKASFTLPDRQKIQEQILLHFKELITTIEKLDQAVISGRIKVSDKNSVSAHLSKARATAEGLLLLENCSLEYTTQERSLVQLNIALEEAIDTWASNPEEIPCDSRFELLANYVDVMADLFLCVKSYDLKQIEQELLDSDSRLLHLSVNYLGATAALALCLLNCKERENVLHQMGMLDLILNLLCQAITDNRLIVDDKKSVFEYLTRVREVMGWTLRIESTTAGYFQAERFRSLAESAVLTISHDWRTHNSSLFARAIAREVVHQNTQFSLGAEGEAFIDSLFLVTRSLQECAALMSKGVS